MSNSSSGSFLHADQGNAIGVCPAEFYESVVHTRIFALSVDDKLSELGLQLETWAIWNTLSEAPQIQRQLAHSIGASKVAISRFVSKLCAAGYISRRPGNSDRRIRCIEITDDGSAILDQATELIRFDLSVTWEDVAELAKQWSGPFVIKGLQSPDDARRAVDVGASAVWISNHGGRQLDGSVAPIDCITPVRDAVGDAVEIIADSGFRRGTQVLKALALGANACAIGRPYLYGLAAAGQKGVERVLQLFRDELMRDMALLGRDSIEQVTAGTVVQRNERI